MAIAWIKEQPALWDADKQRIVGGAAEGIFDPSYRQLPFGQPVPGEWWRVEEDGRVIGYGWMDVVWGDAEILLMAEPAAQGRGVGSFILAHLADEARARGVNYLYNTVPARHPDAAGLTRWLEKRGFKHAEDRSLRAYVPDVPAAKDPG